MQRLSLVVVETEQGLVLTHPPSGRPEAPVSLPSGIVLEHETPAQAAVRLVREQTGLTVEITEHLLDFEQPGTPYGTAAMSGFIARVVGGELREGAEGPPTVYALDDLPPIIPVRVANQTVLDAYLSKQRAS
jgi:ADP-ribose pyrophosphatase YjhB (NUDIX family)